ncbi:hypothetical protein D3C87_1134360 [compost metagenome]
MNLFLLVMAAFVSSSAHADFFTVSEEKLPITEAHFQEPQKIFIDAFEELREEWNSLSPAPSYFLLKFAVHSGDYGTVVEKYNRAKHFGSWIRGHNDNRCLNTRGLVLERDSQGPVSYSSDGCSVKTGHWQDPYAGRSFTDAADIQIDHFVPLKNAYISGAADWTPKKRCLYANFLGNDFHLIAVLGRENMRKSDKSPVGYMPPNAAYRCQYLNQWLKVKMIWAMNLSSEEANRIADLVKENYCDLASFRYSESELLEQRQIIADNANLCQ